MGDRGLISDRREIDFFVLGPNDYEAHPNVYPVNISGPFVVVKATGA